MSTINTRLRDSITSLTRRVDQRFAVTVHWEDAKDYARNYPIRSLFYSSVACMVIIPLLIFGGVIATSIFFGVATLFCVQGAVLTASFVVLLPTLGFGIMFAAGFTVMVYLFIYVVKCCQSVWSWFYGTYGDSINNLVERGANNMHNLNIRGSFTLPAVNYKVTRRSSNGAAGEGDFPRFRAHMVYHDRNNQDQFQNED